MDIAMKLQRSAKKKQKYNFIIMVFTARRCASAEYAVIVCPSSVRLSVCLSQVEVLQRWLNL